MTFFKEIGGLGSSDLWMVLIGVAVMAAAFLPRLLAGYPLSMPGVLVALGALATTIGLDPPDPLTQGTLTEKLTELTVIISLMGAGLKIDRRIGLKRWASTWRLLAITMVITIGAVFLLGTTLLAFAPATAMLLGACIAPTDPVLASDVQVGPPGKRTAHEPDRKRDPDKEEDEVRFSLTSEAGLNDGLAFPFTNLAIAMAALGLDHQEWLGEWFMIDVLYRIGAGVIIGFALGKLLAGAIFAVPSNNEWSRAMVGMGSLAATLVIYGATEFVGGYGFIAVFVGAVMIRNYERDHHYQRSMHQFAEMAEHFLMAMVLIGLGAAIGGGLFKPLTWPLVFAALLIVFAVRPLAGAIGLIGRKGIPWRERFAIGFLGIRGIGSFYYLAYALERAGYDDAEELWAITGAVVVLSIVIHGSLASPLIERMDLLRIRDEERSAGKGRG